MGGDAAGRLRFTGPIDGPGVDTAGIVGAANDRRASLGARSWVVPAGVGFEVGGVRMDKVCCMRSAQQILAEAGVIAVVGASRDPAKPSHSVPLQMLRYGWRIIPVNPVVDEIFGVPTFKTLADIDEPVDLVDIFRPAADAVDIVRQAVAIKAPAVWLQSGIVSADAREIATAAGLDYVEDRCLAVERAIGRLTRMP